LWINVTVPQPSPHPRSDIELSIAGTPIPFLTQTIVDTQLLYRHYARITDLFDESNPLNVAICDPWNITYRWLVGVQWTEAVLGTHRQIIPQQRYTMQPLFITYPRRIPVAIDYVTTVRSEPFSEILYAAIMRSIVILSKTLDTITIHMSLYIHPTSNSNSTTPLNITQLTVLSIRGNVSAVTTPNFQGDDVWDVTVTLAYSCHLSSMDGFDLIATVSIINTTNQTQDIAIPITLATSTDWCDVGWVGLSVVGNQTTYAGVPGQHITTDTFWIDENITVCISVVLSNDTALQVDHVEVTKANLHSNCFANGTTQIIYDASNTSYVGTYSYFTASPALYGFADNHTMCYHFAIPSFLIQDVALSHVHWCSLEITSMVNLTYNFQSNAQKSLITVSTSRGVAGQSFIQVIMRNEQHTTSACLMDKLVNWRVIILWFIVMTII
jgi:hypothetical protein